MLRHLNDKEMMDSPTNRLTKVRQEVKYLIDSDLGPKALKVATEHVPLKVVEGSSSSWRISVYLDGPGRELAKAELNSKGRSIKLRMKDYYNLNGSAPKFGDKVWFEVKARLGTIVEKNRFSVARCDAARVVSNGPGCSDEPTERAAQEAFEAVRVGRELTPLVVTHYRRTTLQDRDSKLRLTFDDHVTYHLPLNGMIQAARGFARADLPPPIIVEPRWIIEVKTTGSLPLWLEDIAGQAKQIEYSKFGTGVRELKMRGLLEIK